MKQKIGVENIDHVGIVVPSIEQAIRHYEKNFNVECGVIKVSKKQKVNISLLKFKIKPNRKAIRGISWKIIIFFTSKKNDEYPNRDYFKTLKRRIK